MNKILDLISIDVLIVVFLGVALFTLNNDLQAQIVAGLIGYLGAKGVDVYAKN